MIHGQFQLPEDLMSELEDIDVTLLKVGGWLAFFFFFFIACASPARQFQPWAVVSSVC